MHKELTSKLNSVPAEFLPIKEFVQRYSHLDSRTDNHGTIQLAKNSKYLDAYFINIFAPANEIYFSNFISRYGVSVPEPLEKFLRFANGFTFCDFTVYGLTPSMYKSQTGTLERTSLQPLDIGTANDVWKTEFDQVGFYFGGRSYSDDTNCGYFLQDGTIFSCLCGGVIVGQWDNFWTFLEEELEVTERNEKSLNTKL